MFFETVHEHDQDLQSLPVYYPPLRPLGLDSPGTGIATFD